MKKILLVAAIASTFMTFAQGEAANATEVQQIGITAIKSSRQSVIVAFSYEGVTADKLVKTTNLTVDDELHGFVNDEYTTWTLKENEGSKYWYANTKSTTKGTKNGTPAVDFSQPVGTGIWLVRQNPTEKKDGVDVPVPFYIYGTPATDKTIKVSAGTTRLIGNPNSTPTSTSPTIIDAAAGDAIYIPNGKAFTKYTYGSNKKWNKGFTELENPPTFDANTGAWYESKGTENVTIEW